VVAIVISVIELFLVLQFDDAEVTGLFLGHRVCLVDDAE
jgi:hypothetical protein